MKYALLALILVMASTAGAQPKPQDSTYPRFDEVEYVYAKNPGRFSRLWTEAERRTVRLAIIGDSQETSPAGAGWRYIPRLGYEFWQTFGNVPETQVWGNASVGGNNNAGWLFRSAAGGDYPPFTRVATNRVPPGVSRPKAHSSTNWSQNLNGQAYGQLTTLLHDASDLPAGTTIPQLMYFNTAGEVRAEVFAATHPESGEVYFRARPRPTLVPSYFDVVTTQGQLVLNLAVPEQAVVSARTPPLDFAGRAFMSVEISGDRDDRYTDVLGMRFVNATHRHGVAITPLSAGGYRARDYLLRHGESGAYFKALGFECAAICYGANDGAGGLTPSEFRADVEQLMATIRGWMNDPTFPFILICDPDHINAHRDHYDRYPGALRAIAEADPHVMLVNSRRLLHDQGWQVGDPRFEQFVSDGVHYTAEGATLKARLDAAAILRAFRGRR
jgi:lysophospholipase L1-like esterase